MSLVKNIVDWMLEKEADMAKNCAIPMKEIEYQINKVEAEKEAIQKKYDEAMAELNDVSAKLQKIKDTETLRCAK